MKVKIDQLASTLFLYFIRAPRPGGSPICETGRLGLSILHSELGIYLLDNRQGFSILRTTAVTLINVVDEILDAILPSGLPEGTPTSFTTAGHLGMKFPFL
jgi:hypothetical protein